MTRDKTIKEREGIKMLSFHNDPLIKEKYINRIKHHQKLDNIIQGTGWKDGRGCAVGCTLEEYDHDRYPIELGLPVWLAHLEDKIFEGLEIEKAVRWPFLFLKAIPVGITEEQFEDVRHKIAVKRLNRVLRYVNIEEKDIIKGIKKVIKCHKNYRTVTKKEWSADVNVDVNAACVAARSAAWSAARSAESAAWSAESAAWSAAQSARIAAQSAAQSVESAAQSAWSAAQSARIAAQSAFYDKEAKELLKQLRLLKKEENLK